MLLDTHNVMLLEGDENLKLRSVCLIIVGVVVEVFLIKFQMEFGNMFCQCEGEQYESSLLGNTGKKLKGK